MANNRNLIKGRATQFSSSNQPANRGRRPSALAKHIKEDRVSLEDIRAFISSLMGSTIDEINAALKGKDGKPPVAALVMLSAIKKDIEKGELYNFEKLMDRAYGKPSQQISVHETGSGVPEDPEERRLLAERLEKELALGGGTG